MILTSLSLHILVDAVTGSFALLLHFRYTFRWICDSSIFSSSTIFVHDMKFWTDEQCFRAELRIRRVSWVLPRNRWLGCRQTARTCPRLLSLWAGCPVKHSAHHTWIFKLHTCNNLCYLIEKFTNFKFAHLTDLLHKELIISEFYTLTLSNIYVRRVCKEAEKPDAQVKACMRKWWRSESLVEKWETKPQETDTEISETYTLSETSKIDFESSGVWECKQYSQG